MENIFIVNPNCLAGLIGQIGQRQRTGFTGDGKAVLLLAERWLIGRFAGDIGVRCIRLIGLPIQRDGLHPCAGREGGEFEGYILPVDRQRETGVLEGLIGVISHHHRCGVAGRGILAVLNVGAGVLSHRLQHQLRVRDFQIQHLMGTNQRVCLIFPAD